MKIETSASVNNKNIKGKMRIEELSVGDWVQAKLAKWDYDSPEETEPMRIVCIDNSEPKQAFADMIGGGMVKHSALIDDLHPIPLTPEILEKNGFEWEQYVDGQEIEYDGYRHILCQDGVQYDIILVDSYDDYFDLEIESSLRDKDGDRILISSELSLNYVEDVHQLQHILRMVGIEKEVCL